MAYKYTAKAVRWLLCGSPADPAAERAAGVTDTSVSAVLLVFSYMHLTEGSGKAKVTKSACYRCENAPGMAVRAADLDGYTRRLPVEAEAELLAAVSKMLAVPAWRPWRFECYLEDGARQFDASVYSHARVVLMRKTA